METMLVRFLYVLTHVSSKRCHFIVESICVDAKSDIEKPGYDCGCPSRLQPNIAWEFVLESAYNEQTYQSPVSQGANVHLRDVLPDPAPKQGEQNPRSEERRVG